MRLIKFFFRMSPLDMTLAVGGGVVSGVLNVLFIVGLTVAMRGHTGAGAAWQFLGLWGAMVVARFVSELVLLRLSQRQVYELRLRLCRQIIRVPLRQLEMLGSHPLLTSLTEDVMAVTQAGASIPSFCSNVTIVVACLIYCAVLSPTVFAAVFAATIVGITVHKAIGRAAARHMAHVRERQELLMKQFRTLINGSKELKLSATRRARLMAAIEKTTSTMRQHVIDASIRYATAGVISQTLYFLLLATLMFLLPVLSTQWRREILAGAVLTVLAMRGSVEVVVGFAPGLMRAEVSLKKIERLGIQLSSFGATRTIAPEPVEPARRVDLVDVAFTYRSDDGTRFDLGPMNLAFSAGEIVFISGGNGSGKTTLAKLIAGLYVPESGAIRVNGLDVTDGNREQYREQFSAVFSDFHLDEELPGPVDPSIDDRARNILVRLQLDRKVKIDNGRLSTTDLSTGQRKRLALLTAYLEDRPVYLFDEWAADQDSRFRQFFYHDILPSLKRQGKALVVITHDEQYYDVADRVVYLEEGRVRRIESAAARLQPVAV